MATRAWLSAAFRTSIAFVQHARTSTGLKAEIVRGAAGVVMVRGGGALLALGSAVLPARLLGPEEFGIYSFILAMAMLLVVPVQFGLPSLLMRETARAEVEENWARMKGLWQWADRVAVVASVVLLTLAWFIWPLVKGAMPPGAAPGAAFAWGLVLVPLMGLLGLREAALQGLRKVVQALLAAHVFRPALFIFLLGSVLVLTGRDLSAMVVVAVQAVAVAAAFVLGTSLRMRAKPSAVSGSLRGERNGRTWIKAVLPLAFITGTWVIVAQTDKVMLGLLVETAEVGLYAAADWGATVVSFGLMLVGAVVSPYFARLHAQGDKQRLHALLNRATLAATALALPPFIAFVLWGEAIVTFAFGAAFAPASLPLAFLAAGQMGTALVGLAGPLLAMAGFERDIARRAPVAALANAALNLILIPPFGAAGAAVATMTTLIVWGLLLRQMVCTHLGIGWGRRDGGCRIQKK